MNEEQAVRIFCAETESAAGTERCQPSGRDTPGDEQRLALTMRADLCSRSRLARGDHRDRNALNAWLHPTGTGPENLSAPHDGAAIPGQYPAHLLWTDVEHGTFGRAETAIRHSDAEPCFSGIRFQEQ